MAKSQIRYFKAQRGAMILFRASRSMIYTSYRVMGAWGCFSTRPYVPSGYVEPVEEIGIDEYRRLVPLKEARIRREMPAGYRPCPSDSWVRVAEWETGQ
jgi:hypothetical protein